MNVVEAIVLGMIQGVTEFLPVSSSGHLVLGQNLLGIKEPMMAFNVAVHLGTLLAVAIYFPLRNLEMSGWHWAGLAVLLPAACLTYFFMVLKINTNDSALLADRELESWALGFGIRGSRLGRCSSSSR